MFRIQYEDGAIHVIGTDSDWSVTTGVIRYSELYHGERQDFSCERPGREPVGRAVAFDRAGQLTRIVARQSEPVRITQRIPVREKLVTPRGELVLDFGQNLAGFVEVRLPGGREEPWSSPMRRPWIRREIFTRKICGLPKAGMNMSIRRRRSAEWFIPILPIMGSAISGWRGLAEMWIQTALRPVRCIRTWSRSGIFPAAIPWFPGCRKI